MVLTMGLLFGGTPVVLYGEEIGLDQVKNKDEKI
jgi:glycosidase